MSSSGGNPSSNDTAGGNSGGGSAPSPGKGGKFLELMQRRLKEQQHSQPPAPPTLETQPSISSDQPPAVTALSSSQQKMQPTANVPLSTNDVSSAPTHQALARPKGKDFASLSARGPRASPTVLSQPQPPQQQQQQHQQHHQNFPPQQQQQQQQLPPHQQPQTSTAPLMGKPKGKDFSAMASRMTAPAPAPIQPPFQHAGTTDQAAQVARAAQMQAEARAAAGLPPLSKPTATTVTTTLPNIPPPRVKVQQQQHPHGTVGGQLQPGQQHSQPRVSSQGYNVSGHHQSTQQQQQQQQQHFASQPNPIYGSGNVPIQDHNARLMSSGSGVSTSGAGMQRSRPAPVITSQLAQQQQQQPSQQQQQQQQHRRNSKTATTTTTAAPKKGPTPVPTSVEAKVTMQSSAAISPAVQPYMAPLVGQRIQDLVSSLDPAYTIDSQAQEQLLQLADDFLDKVCKQSLRIAAHRGSGIVDVQDVQLVLAKQWGIVIPGLGPPMLNQSRMMSIANKPHPMTNSSSHSASGTKRKAPGSSKTSSGNTIASQQVKSSKANDVSPMKG